MTLRDWFAGQIVASLLGAAFSGTGHIRATEVAERAYQIADAMLDERGRA